MTCSVSQPAYLQGSKIQRIETLRLYNELTGVSEPIHDDNHKNPLFKNI